VITVIALGGAVFIEATMGQGCFYTVGMTVNSGLITVLIIQLVVLARTSYAWLEIGLLRWLGSISYSLYLYHVTVIDLVNHYLPGQRWRVHVACSIILSVLAAVASCELVEKPFLRMKERFSLKKPPLVVC
jgi:peptidoglycan/LPS O-acetylase OafA/YrhL